MKLKLVLNSCQNRYCATAIMAMKKSIMNVTVPTAQRPARRFSQYAGIRNSSSASGSTNQTPAAASKRMPKASVFATSQNVHDTAPADRTIRNRRSAVCADM